MLALWCALFGLFCQHAAAGQVAPAPAAPASAPLSVSVEDREHIKDLRIEAYHILASLKEAEKARLQAQLDAERSQQQLDALNARINQETGKLREKCHAPEELWDIDPKTFEWQHKKETRK